jgi:hypothetical protein
MAKKKTVPNAMSTARKDRTRAKAGAARKAGPAKGSASAKTAALAKKSAAVKKSAPAKKSAPKSSSPRRRASGTNEVRIRMYRHGLGDCFLIRFRKPGADDFHVVIDCGVLTGSPDGPNRLRQSVENIEKETGENGVDLLIATHEHADHLSGFNQASTTWESIAKKQIKKTWLGWTENLSSPAVKALKARQRRRLMATLAGMARMQSLAGTSPALGEQAGRILGLLDFSHDEGEDPMSLLNPGMAGDKLPGPARALLWIKEHAASALEYCHPNDPPRILPGFDEVRVFTLGPPVGPLLKYEDPDQGEGYLSRATLDFESSFGLAVADDPNVFGTLSPPSAEPFDAFYKLPYDQVKSMVGPAGRGPSPTGVAVALAGFFRDHYGFVDADPSAYRRIDNDWLSLAEGLALSQIHYVNNTSLALAFELGEGGPVLLFPGDAQAGSWLSWSDLTWEVPTGSGRRTVTGPELLSRVVFYKVGHHGSHNATMKAKGLELMGNPELVAFIPVHQKTAHNHHPEWVMPWPNLWKRLKEKANGRVILSDRDEKKAAQIKLPAGADQQRWKDFVDALDWDDSGEDLWVDYTVRY